MEHNPDHEMPTLFMPTTKRSNSSGGDAATLSGPGSSTQHSFLGFNNNFTQSPSLSPKSTMGGASPDMSSSEPSSAGVSLTLSSTQISQISPPAYALPRAVLRKNSSKTPKVAPIPEDDSLDGFGLSKNDQSKHYDMNHDLKTTLTDLLNCDTVRKDPKMRLLVQSRLMDSERELKRQRRCRQRQSSLPTPTIVLSSAEDDRRRESLA